MDRGTKFPLKDIQVATRYVEYAQHHVIKERQAQTLVRCHLTPVRMAIAQKTGRNRCR